MVVLLLKLLKPALEVVNFANDWLNTSKKVWLRKPSASKKVSSEQFHRKNTKIIVYLKLIWNIVITIALLTNSGFDLNNTVSKVAIWMVIALILFSIFQQFDGTRGMSREISYSQFMRTDRAIKSAVVDGRTVSHNH